jgi:hypothetical protein
MRKLVLLVLTTGCMGVSPQGNLLSMTKQKQRVLMLQKKLELAERGRDQAEEEVRELQTALYRSQLALIVKQIELYEKQVSLGKEDKGLTFLKERGMLQQMMEMGPSPEALEAQSVLDRILRMITKSHDAE